VAGNLVRALAPAGLGARRVAIAAVTLATLASCGRDRGEASVARTSAPVFVATTQATLNPTDGTDQDFIGTSVAVDGDTAIVGGNGANANAGAAWVFVRTAGVWSQQAKLAAPGSALFGWGVAVKGNTAMIGSDGAAYVFTRTGTTWSSATKLPDPGGGTSFSDAVALGNGTALLGSPIGAAAYVYVGTGSAWTLQATLKATPTAYSGIMNVGGRVDLDQDTAILGVHGYYGSSGLNGAYVFTRTGTTWTQQAELVPSGVSPTGSAQVGRSVAVRGDTAVVGVPYDGAGGRAVVFTRAGSTWTQQTVLAHTGSSGFGTELTLSGNDLAVRNEGGYGGSGYLFTRAGAVWTEQTSFAFSAVSLALSGNTLVTGTFINGNVPGYGTVYLVGGEPGDACALPGDCRTGNCVDGVCCNTACTGLCQSCVAAKTGGTSGTCAPIKDGTDPDAECPGAACAAGTKENGHVCNGAGACRVTTSKACAPYVCNAAANDCTAACSTDGDCAASAYCSGSTCLAKKTTGASCATTHECASGFCVDGVCCDAACNGVCQACAAAKKSAGADGSCGFAADGLDPHGSCAAATCVGSTLTSRVCNGSGACRDKPSSCAPFTCNAAGTNCNLTCSKDADCGAAGTDYCAADGTCQPKKKSGTLCGGAGECASGFCVDGVCCSTQCNGACQACGEGTSAGTCIAVSGTPRAGHPACTNGGTTCGGLCDGSKLFDCTFPGAATVCGSGCKDGAIAHCDGAGTCGASTPCAGHFGCADANTCKASCAGDSDCVGTFKCKAGVCSEPTATCSTDGLSSTSASGEVRACAPYRCTTAGTCADQCTTTDDCAPGNVCDVTVPPGKCAPPPATPATSDAGCGCEAPGTRAASTGWIGLGIAALVFARRRRRRA
jgi:MYXO-CTERM domain-containing protein